MNCKPGDLAWITHPGMYGTLVEILHAAPVGQFKLPDGQPATCVNSDCWVFEFLGRPKKVGVTYHWGEGSRLAKFAACQDKWLRPIRDLGDDAVDETLQRLAAPIIQPKINEDKSEVAHG